MPLALHISTKLLLLDIDGCAHPYPNKKTCVFKWQENMFVTLEMVKQMIRDHNRPLVEMLITDIKASDCQQVLVACGSARTSPFLDLLGMAPDSHEPQPKRRRNGLPVALVLYAYVDILKEDLAKENLNIEVELDIGSINERHIEHQGNMPTDADKLDFNFGQNNQTYEEMIKHYRQQHLLFTDKQPESQHWFNRDRSKRILVPHQITYMRERHKLTGSIDTSFYDDKIPILIAVDDIMLRHADILLPIGDIFRACHFRSSQEDFNPAPQLFQLRAGGATKRCVTTENIWANAHNFYCDDDGKTFFRRMRNITMRTCPHESPYNQIAYNLMQASIKSYQNMRWQPFRCRYTFYNRHRQINDDKQNFYSTVVEIILSADTGIIRWACAYAAQTPAARYQPPSFTKKQPPDPARYLLELTGESLKATAPAPKASRVAHHSYVNSG